MGHMTLPRPYQRQFVVRRLWLPHSTCTSNLKSLWTPIMKMHNDHASFKDSLSPVGWDLLWSTCTPNLMSLA